MFPTIYGIALKGLGDDAKFGAAGLIMAILGGSVLPPLQELVDMPDAHVHMEPDLQGGETRVSGDVGISFLIWDMTVIGFACGIPLIKWFIKLRKQAPDVKNDTNSQSGKDEQHGKQAEDQPQRNDGDLHEQGAGDGQQ